MIKIAQITDSHLGDRPGEPILAMNPDESLIDVLTLVNQQHPHIDLLLATGDIANHASASAYQRFYSTATQYIQAPFAWLPGNHDDPALMEPIVAHSSHRVIEYEHWAVILLNSRVPRQTHGFFEDSELAYLQAALSQYRHKHCLISFHHQPVPIGSAWMDNYIIRNADAFWQVVDGNTAVKGIVWGHVHQDFTAQRNHMHLLSTPSTCVQFKPNEDDFTVDTTMPGYRWLELHDDGTLLSEVARVKHKDYGIDFSSGGY